MLFAIVALVGFHPIFLLAVNVFLGFFHFGLLVGYIGFIAFFLELLFLLLVRFVCLEFNHFTVSNCIMGSMLRFASSPTSVTFNS